MTNADLDQRIADALGAPFPHHQSGRDAVMARVRALPPADRPVRRGGRFGIRAVRHSLVGAALAASVGSLATLSSMIAAPAGSRPIATAVIGDSVGATLRDTLRLVRLIFADTSARQVLAVGDVARGAAGTALQRDPVSRRWSAVVALRDGAHRYAFVVDGTRWVVDPTAPRVRADDGRLYSILQVAAATN